MREAGPGDWIIRFGFHKPSPRTAITLNSDESFSDNFSKSESYLEGMQHFYTEVTGRLMPMKNCKRLENISVVKNSRWGQSNRQWRTKMLKARFFIIVGNWARCIFVYRLPWEQVKRRNRSWEHRTTLIYFNSLIIKPALFLRKHEQNNYWCI